MMVLSSLPSKDLGYLKSGKAFCLKEPILEVVAGLVDGSTTGLIAVLSAAISLLTGNAAFSAQQLIFTAFLALTAVAITNFLAFPWRNY